MRSNASSNIENNDKFCFLCSILAYLHPCNKIYPNRVSKYEQYVIELNSTGFDFTNGFKCSDVQRFENLNNLSINIFELNFYQDQNKWKHNIIPIEIKKTDSDKIIDLLIYKIHQIFIKKLRRFSGNRNCNYV